MGTVASSNGFAGRATLQEKQLNMPCVFPIGSFSEVMSTARQQVLKRKRRSSIPARTSARHLVVQVQPPDGNDRVRPQDNPAIRVPVQPPQENKRFCVPNYQYAHTKPVGEYNQDTYPTRLRAPDAPAEPEAGISLERDFECIRMLGESTEGKVWLMKSKKSPETPELYAVKVLKGKPMSRFPKDVLLHLRTIRIHPHIVFCSQIDIVNGSIWQCLEYCHGDLTHYCKKRQQFPVSPQGHQIWCLMVITQLAEAIAYLHHGLRREEGWVTVRGHSSICHYDIKPANILLHFSPNHKWPTVLLGDFGLASLASEPILGAGTSLYFCPEAAAAARGKEGQLMSTASDIYTFALTVYFLITGSHWRTGVNPRFIELQAEYDQLSITRMLRFCLAVSPRARPIMNCHGGLGILPAVDEARKVQDELIARYGHLDAAFWGNWRKEALQIPIANPDVRPALVANIDRI